MGKKIISMSLWGDHPMYTVGAIRNAEMNPIIFGSDWITRIYIGNDVPSEVCEKLVSLPQTECVFLPNEDPNWNGMFWRFWAISDEDVDLVIFRDTDSRPSIRDSAAVQEWIESGKMIHLMRDHPYHKTEILGGMWGVKKPLLNDMKGLMGRYKMGNFWQTDQNFLREKVYPIVKDQAMVHDEYFDKTGFPSPRVDGEFVGEAFNENDELLHPEHREILK